MEWYLPPIWAGIIGSAVVLYVILDGFDLGIGMLFPFAKDDKERDQMMPAQISGRSHSTVICRPPYLCLRRQACRRARPPARRSTQHRGPWRSGD